MADGKDERMIFKWIGAVLIILGSGGFGLSLAANHRREERNLQQMINGLDYMQCELQFRLTPLPDLCLQASREQKGNISAFLKVLSEELESQISPDVASCVRVAAAKSGQLPNRVRNALTLLGSSLGRFDTEGQIRGLEQVRQFCRDEIKNMNENKENRLRSYQTLSLCAGAALAILFV